MTITSGRLDCGTANLPMSNSRTELEKLVRTCTSGSSSRLELWQRIIRALAPERVLEIGVWRGEFAERILGECPSIRSYYMLDPWRVLQNWNKPLNGDALTFEDAYNEAVARTNFAAARIIVLRGTTVERIDSIPDETLDFAYIDGDHTLRGITIDLVRVYPKIRAGGFVAGDDLTPTIWQHDTRYEPTLVFPFAAYFAEAVGGCLFALPFHQFLMQKEAGTFDQPFHFVDLIGDYRDDSLLPQLSPYRFIRQRIRGALPPQIRRLLRSFRH